MRDAKALDKENRQLAKRTIRADVVLFACVGTIDFVRISIRRSRKVLTR
jgi:hypothetical protein